MLQANNPSTASLLVIDDDALLRAAIRHYFEDTGFSVLEAENGQVGLEVFGRHKPDLVITDLQMPLMGGLEVLSSLMQSNPETPVVVISEASALNEFIQALRMGAWDYLVKPIPQLSVLEHAVCRCLERARLIEENRRYRAELESANQSLKKNLAILKEDQEAGRHVQRRLLPKQEQTFGGYHFSHHFVPSLYLSGDFVDYFALNEHHLAFYIADVSGHGSSSAFVTVLLRSLIVQILSRYQAQGDTTILEPAQLLTQLSHQIYEAQLGKYLTMIYGVIDRRNHQLRYSVAGHYPNPILFNPQQSSFLLGRGFPVGIMRETTYESYQHAFSPGMRLILCSDGIFEILEAANLAEKEALLLNYVQQSQGALGPLIECLSLEQRKGLPDDLTLLSVQCT